MPKRLKRLKEEILQQNSWFLFKHDRYEQPDGTTGDYFYIETTGSVLIIPEMPDGRLALTLQHRYLQDKQSIEFPAGHIPTGQEPDVAARTEVREETGCVLDELVKVGTFEPANGTMRSLCHVYRGFVVSQQSQELDQTEDIEVLYRQPAEIDEMIKNHDIWDGLTMAAWALARSYFLT